LFIIVVSLFDVSIDVLLFSVSLFYSVFVAPPELPPPPPLFLYLLISNFAEAPGFSKSLPFLRVMIKT
jgi:hypothetical protein